MRACVCACVRVCVCECVCRVGHGKRLVSTQMSVDRVTGRTVSRWRGAGRELDTWPLQEMSLLQRWLQLQQVRTQDQTRVCRSDHRTKHECASHTTGPNTSVVQVRSQDQTRVCRSDDWTKHETTGQLICSQRMSKTMDLYIRDICCVGGLLAATRSSYSSTPSRTLSMKRVVGNPDAYSNLCRLANFAACSFSCRSV